MKEIKQLKLEGISVNHIELTPAIEKYVRSRIQKLSKIVQHMEPATIRVEVGKPSTQRKKGADLFYAELQATIQDMTFRANRNDTNVYKAIEKARDDLHQQILKWKKKGRSIQRKNGAITKRLLRSDHDGM
ncbi:ribosome-associated translation inhibitor RaiA [Candidatus Uhrbacteria bacterium]|nr:ribosome-associated translation inhibitor RaiA [Candidatus Uhrbacteria bacterium]